MGEMLEFIILSFKQGVHARTGQMLTGLDNHVFAQYLIKVTMKQEWCYWHNDGNSCI
jgi:hypothetical protein